MMMKKCKKCGQEKPLADYYVNSHGIPYARCKVCLRAYRREYYHHGGGKDQSRIYHYLNQEKLALLNKKYLPKKYNRNYDSAKSIAWSAVTRALKSGVMVRPSRCEECGVECKPVAHHGRIYDVDHRLDVRWLCTKCHTLALYPEYREVISAYQNSQKGE